MKCRVCCFQNVLLLIVTAGIYCGSFATFSICAVDTVTKEVGSAGASCIDGAIILSDVFPNKGVIHTQAAYDPTNQQRARTRMNQGDSPQQIITYMTANDVQSNPSTRQYGVVDLVNNGRSAGYTGSGCQNYKNHVNGKTYAIQGNILLGKKILDSMEVRFNRTNGTLADKLMAALQGAKVDGADTRCDLYNKSTISAFIRVAKPTDTNKFYLDLNVGNTPTSKDPIDSLQKLYTNWQGTHAISTGPVKSTNHIILGQNYPNPFNRSTAIQYSLSTPSHVVLTIFSTSGREIVTLVNEKQQANQYDIIWDGVDRSGKPVNGGVYVYKIQTSLLSQSRRMLVVR